MTVLSLLLLLLVAGICGALGQAISGFSRGGCLVSIALGFIGALLGGWLKQQFNLPEPLVLEVLGVLGVLSVQYPLLPEAHAGPRR